MIVFAFNFEFSFASLFPAQNNSVNKNPNNPNGNPEIQYFVLRVQINIHLQNTENLIKLENGLISMKIYDNVLNSLALTTTLTNDTVYEASLRLGVYNITIIIPFILPTILVTNQKLNNLQFTYTFFSVYLSNIIVHLDKNKFLTIFLELYNLKPNTVNIYDMDGNSIIEYEKKERIIVNTQANSINEFAQNNYSLFQAILFMNKYASGISERKNIIVANETITYIFDKYVGTIKNYIDITNLTRVDICVILVKTNISDYKNE